MVVCQWFLWQRRQPEKQFSLLKAVSLNFLTVIISNDNLCQKFLKMKAATLQVLHSKLSIHFPPTTLPEEYITALGIHFLSKNPTMEDQCLLFAVSNTFVRRARVVFLRAVICTFRNDFTIAQWISDNTFNYESPYEEFDGLYGAMDGTHVPMRVYSFETDRYRNRKTFISTNVLLLCSMEMQILFCYAGYEGCGHDSAVFKCSALQQIFEQISGDYFVLGDAGYALSPSVLTPFRSVRYHLQEYVGNVPKDYKELYNLRHAKSRVVIERTIGVLKALEVF